MLSFSRLLADAKLAKREKKAALVAIMRDQLPDFAMQVGWAGVAGELSAVQSCPRSAPRLLRGVWRAASPTQPCTIATPTCLSQLRWELGSPLFGLLLRHYAPDDTYQLWKVGQWGSRWGGGGAVGPGVAPPSLLLLAPLSHPPSYPPTRAAHALPLPPQVGDRLRVDGTLMGLDDAKRSFIPRWKRGHFSLLVDAGGWGGGQGRAGQGRGLLQSLHDRRRHCSARWRNLHPPTLSLSPYLPSCLCPPRGEPNRRPPSGPHHPHLLRPV